MKRSRSKTPVRITKDAEKLISMAASRIACGSVVEDYFWSDELLQRIGQLFDRGNDALVESALDHSFHANLPAHECLSTMVEAASESFEFQAEDRTPMQALLITIPILAWSSYRIPSGTLSEAQLAPVLSHLHGHVVAREARVAVSPFLYALDHLPRGYSETRKLMKRMAEAAMSGSRVRVEAAKLGEAVDFPADIRLLLAVVVHRKGAPTFQWQEAELCVSRHDVFSKWEAQCRPNLAKLVEGAAFECLLPDAFFRNARECDLRIRPHMLSASIGSLAAATNTEPSRLSAVIAGVGEDQVDEYRVSFLKHGENDVLHGAVWPLYGSEDDDTNPSPRAAIEALLSQHKLADIEVLPGVMPPEYCEDCGAPLFYDRDGEAVHAELPEGTPDSGMHYH